VERAVGDGRLSQEQGEFLLELLIRTRHLHFHDKAELCRAVSRVVRESDQDARRGELWALRSILRRFRPLEDTVHAMFVKFGP